VAELVGRDTELAGFDASLRAVERGEAVAIAVEGEAGIGKSALLGAVRERARAARMLVLEGRAAEQDRDMPFGVIADALDDELAATPRLRLQALGEQRLAQLAAVFPALGAAGSVDRFHLHRALRALLELLAGQQPLVLLLDDAHWADAASLELAAHLLRRPLRVPHLLVAAFRPGQAAAGIVDALRSSAHGREMELRPLAADGARALLGGLEDGAAERVLREAHGNPLFLRELARAAGGLDGLPTTLLAAIGRETRSLGEDTRRLLEGAAVAGDPFDPELAATAAGVAPEGAPALLDELVAADLVRPAHGPRSFAFRHPLVRRAVYDAAPPGWRLGAHERAAAALAARGAPSAERAFHAVQYARAGDREAIALLERAGDEAMASAPAAAAHWYEAAAALAPAEERPGLDVRRFRALVSAGRAGEAVALGNAVIGGPLPPGLEPTVLIEILAGTEGMLGHPERTVARSRAALEAGPPAEAVARLCASPAMLALPDPARTREWVDRMLGARPQGMVLAQAHGCAALAAQVAGEDPSEHFEAAVAGVAAGDDRAVATRFGSLLTLLLAHYWLERFAEIGPLADRAERLAEATAQSHWTSSIAHVRAVAALELGPVGEALAQAEIAEESARLMGHRVRLVAALGMQALALDLADRPLDARRAGEEALRAGRDIARLPEVRIARAQVAALDAAADPERFLAAAAETGVADPLVASPTSAVWLSGLLVAAELDTGQRGRARVRADAMAEMAERYSLPVGCIRALRARAAVLLAEGDADVLAAAAEEAGALEAASLRGAAARMLRRLGHTVPGAPRPAGAGLEALSPRERELAGLVAGGRSNKQIAAALHLSEKTVENGLSRVYAKLGLRGRAELAAAVARGER
jgi:DNA-binding CsgD family transcriptional regulator